eukprot:m.122389 g.122389  ORF g.122389 m.122389 type:complete len:930 (+) comp16560_c0_seq1:189-2978(+)
MERLTRVVCAAVSRRQAARKTCQQLLWPVRHRRMRCQQPEQPASMVMVLRECSGHAGAQGGRCYPLVSGANKPWNKRTLARQWSFHERFCVERQFLESESGSKATGWASKSTSAGTVKEAVFCKDAASVGTLEAMPVSPKRVSLRSWSYSARTVVDASTGRWVASGLSARRERSHRAGRQFGSDRFLLVAFDMTNTGPSSSHQQHQPLPEPPREFELAGREYRFLCGRSSASAMYLAVRGPGLRPLLPEQVVRWHIPPHLNPHLSLATFASRMQLAFSKTTPTVSFGVGQMVPVADVVSGTSGAVMTDGCAGIAPDVMACVAQHLGLTTIPTAVQARIGACKGVWYTDPAVGRGTIEYRVGSQKKYRLPNNCDAAQRVLEVNRHSGYRGPAALNPQFIAVLASLGVGASTFVHLAHDALCLLRTVLSGGAGGDEGVGGDRGSGRVSGDVGCSATSGSGSGGDGGGVCGGDGVCRADTAECGGRMNTGNAVSHDRTARRLIASWDVPVAATAHQLLVAGFRLNEPYIQKLLRRAVASQWAHLSNRLHVPVRRSTNLLLVSDPTGTLAPGECFVQLSNEADSQPAFGKPVVMIRNPALLPSDVALLTNTYKPQLGYMVDVAVLPSTGLRPAADTMAGGDYDGDTAFCCWDKRVVQPVKEHRGHCHGSDDLGPAAELDDVKLERRGHMPMAVRAAESVVQALHGHFEVGLANASVFGLVSYWHALMVDARGADHPDARRLARLCSQLVDAPKTGAHLPPPALAALEKQCSVLPVPHWYKAKASGRRGSHRSASPVSQVYIAMRALKAKANNTRHLGPGSQCVDPRIDAFLQGLPASQRAEVDRLRRSIVGLRNEYNRVMAAEASATRRSEYVDAARQRVLELSENHLTVAALAYQATVARSPTHSFCWAVCREQLCRLMQHITTVQTHNNAA